MSAAGGVTSVANARAVRKLSIRRKLLYSFVCMVVFLIFCEAAVRVRAWIKYGTITGSADSSLVFVDEYEITIPRAGLESSGQVCSVKINSLGFRGEELVITKPAGTIRIACVGASTTYCLGVSNNDTAWPHVLQEKLRRTHPDVKWEVVNAGVPGHTMAQSLKNLIHRVLPLNPDLVIFYEPHNQMVIDTMNLARERGVIDADAGQQSNWVSLLANYSLLFSLVHKNVGIYLGSNETKSGKLNGLPPDLPKTYVDVLAAMHSELKARHIPLVVLTFVVKFRRDQDRATQIANSDISFYWMRWMSMDDLLDGVDSYNKAIVAFGQANAVPVVEDSESIPADRHHFLDCVHFADAGAALMADRVFRHLRNTEMLNELIVACAKRK